LTYGKPQAGSKLYFGLSSGKENAENNGRGYLLPGDRLEARGFGAVM
jgi:hypothetical protein